ncbi:hypothetical protein SAMN00777080_3136 [Aquiflexum balticum DSM 16537]|uniref:Uncharacterized protein n=1 Tax=Aquiflexum balticum DSM 16537 TaxID=758820 RepID=A0A1W2H6Z8_9BACT|nr:hypothetical protein [Aquiflexum balticum]SMD44514.1 hypothetical protein SAMN00777080_3136 [Aquiflexum balticum DSM 16537]
MKQLDPEHIPGIYNWCDRWCERCKMTSKCFLYAQEQEDKAIMDSDLDQDEKMEKMREKLMETMEMLSEAAEEFEMEEDDMDELDEEEQDEMMHDHEINKIKIDIHPLSDLSEVYMNTCMDWVNSKTNDLSFGPLLLGKIPEEISNENEVAKLRKIISHLESIQWYQTMIPVKCRGALNYFSDRSFWDDYPIEERAYNGASKVALICIQNSIDAWQGVLFWSKDEEESILPLLEKLIQIKEILEEEFPDAYKFIRPGFDENC